MENGHPVTKAELEAVLKAALSAQDDKIKAALSAQDDKLRAALSAQDDKFKAALSAQDDKFKAGLSAQGDKFKAALSAQDDKFKAALSAQDDKFKAALSAQKDELTETIRDVETHLLTEFHRYAKGQQARLHTQEVSVSDLILRMATIEDRLLALESRRPPTV